MAKDLKFADLILVYGGMLTEKQRDVLELYYDEDLSLGEIAENLSISRQGVRDSIKRGEETLEQLEEQLGLMRKQKAFDELIDTLTQQAQVLCKSLSSSSIPHLVKQNAQTLLNTIESNSDILD